MLPLLALLSCGSEPPVSSGLHPSAASPPARRLESVREDGAQSGTALAAGDVDGDGYADVFVGAPGAAGADGDDTGAGSVGIHYGSADGLSSPADETVAASDGSAGAGFGTSLAFLGDVDGDGYGDLLVGTDDVDGPGAAYVYYGASAGLDPDSEQRLDPVDSDTTSGLGVAVAAAGDVDGDGYADALVGVTAGSPQLHLGGPSGLDVDGQLLETAWGLDEDDGYGSVVAGAGDVDGDGYDDLLVGAPDHVAHDDARGVVQVFLGGPDGADLDSELQLTPPADDPGLTFGWSLAGLGDTDDDGYDDIAVAAAAIDTVQDARVYIVPGSATGPDDTAVEATAPPGAGAIVERPVLHGPGDVDGDGRVDLLIGDPEAGSVGRAELSFGDPEGYGLGGGWLLEAPDVSDTSDHHAHGTSLASGDVDSDGYTDLLVGDPRYVDDRGELGSFARYAGDCERSWYTDADGDGYGDPDTETTGCTRPDDVVGNGDDCDDDDAGVNPGEAETWYDGVDVNCDEDDEYDADGDGADSDEYGGLDCADDDESVTRESTWYLDADGDGFGDPDEAVDACYAPDGYVDDDTDCDDGDADAHPGGTEVWYDGVDGDCDGGSDYDADADGYDRDDDGGEDCDDTDEDVNPDAYDWWYDGVDSDCDGASDYDVDGDGYDSDEYGGEDCDDTDAEVNPDGTEATGDGVDGDCDGSEVCWADADGDGYRSGDTVSSDDLDCDDDGEASAEAWTGDCDDGDPDVHPGGIEGVGDGVDGDCDGAEVCYVDEDGDGVRTEDTVTSTDEDCDDDGEATADAEVGDCDDDDPTIHPGAEEEVADGVDQDCDDDELCWLDDDGDGWVDGFATIDSADLDCEDRDEAGADALDGDCDDEDATVHPGAEEVPDDGIDQDCDGEDDSTGGSDTGGSDTGGSDTGGSDDGGTDSGGSDTGGSDTGGSDDGGADSGGSDTGGSDTGGSDDGDGTGSDAGDDGTEAAPDKTGCTVAPASASWFSLLPLLLLARRRRS